MPRWLTKRGISVVRTYPRWNGAGFDRRNELATKDFADVGKWMAEGYPCASLHIVDGSYNLVCVGNNQIGCLDFEITSNA